MPTHDQYIELSALPEEVRKKVLAFAAELMEQWRNKNAKKGPEPPKKKMIPGLAEGKIVVPDDFNEPLDDFREYME